MPIAIETLRRADAAGQGARLRRRRVRCCPHGASSAAALPADVERHVRRRDGQCRVPGCEATRGLQIHHTQPLCDHPETFDPAKLAAVCPYHHRFLEPHGPYRLIGNAEDADSLRLVRRDEWVRDGPDP